MAAEKTTEIAEAVFSHFMATGREANAAEISAGVTFSESTVRKVLREWGCVPGTDYVKQGYNVFSANYPGQLQSTRYRDAYVPSRQFMREQINIARAVVPT